MPDGAVVLPLPDDGLTVQVGPLAQHGVDGKHSVRGQLGQQLPEHTTQSDRERCDTVTEHTTQPGCEY